MEKSSINAGFSSKPRLITGGSAVQQASTARKILGNSMFGTLQHLQWLLLGIDQSGESGLSFRHRKCAHNEKSFLDSLNAASSFWHGSGRERLRGPPAIPWSPSVLRLLRHWNHTGDNPRPMSQ